MKKFIAFTLCLALIFALAGCAQKDDRVTINVYNWGQYISEGNDGCIDVIREFEKAYPNIRVNYATFDSNETMYAKMANGGITVDVIIPSDYMVDRLIEEDMLMELNFDNIPNAKNISSFITENLEYDPEQKYSVPYAWGVVGIIYNSKYVDEDDVTGWELLWNEKYEDKILMFDNSRDAFCIAQKRLGYDVNTPDPQELLRCAELLAKQRPIVQQYIMDQVFDLMENEEAWIAPYYAGDYLTMAEENEDLCFYLPVDQGHNVFVDAMCIPTCCKEKEAAETFINFLCDPEIAGRNMDSLGYATPETAAKAYMDADLAASPIAYPSEDVLSHGTAFKYLPEETNRLMENLFNEVRSH